MFVIHQSQEVQNRKKKKTTFAFDWIWIAFCLPIFSEFAKSLVMRENRAHEIRFCARVRCFVLICTWLIILIGIFRWKCQATWVFFSSSAISISISYIDVRTLVKMAFSGNCLRIGHSNPSTSKLILNLLRLVCFDSVLNSQRLLETVDRILLL